MTLSRRAFALPLVVLLSVSATLMAAVMLDRVTTQTLTVQRTLDRYRAFHQERGVREMINFWLNNTPSRRAADTLDPDGRAFDLQLADGSLVSIFMFDGQGAMLSDLSGLAEADRQLAAQMLAQLRTLPAAVPDSERAYGPVAISANTAAPAVLRAAAVSIAGTDPGGAFANALLEARASKPLTNQNFNEAASKAEIAGEVRGRLARAITTEPGLWRVLVEVRGTHNGPVIARAEAYAMSPARTRGGPQFMRALVYDFHWIVPGDPTNPANPAAPAPASRG